MLFFVTLAKVRLCWKFSLQIAIMKFHGDFSIGSLAFPRGQTEAWAGITELIVTSRSFIVTSSKNLMIL